MKSFLFIFGFIGLSMLFSCSNPIESSQISTPTPTASASPTPTASASPTPTASASPTPTASASPTPTASASPTPTASASPTPTASASPTPTATPTIVAAQWAKTIVSGSSQNFLQFTGVARDTYGNSYAVGYLDGTSSFDFGNGISVSGTNPQSNPVIVKYNSAGTPQWARSITAGNAGFGNVIFNGVTCDNNGNIYAVGYMDTSSVFSFGNGVSAFGRETNSSNLVIVKYDSSGTALWAKTEASGTSSEYLSVTCDNNGGIYAVGKFFGNSTAVFDNGITVTGTTFSGSNPIIVKYNSSGIVQWACTHTSFTDSSSTDASIFNSVTCDLYGNIFAAGYIGGTRAHGFGNTVTANGSNAINPIIVKYNTSGTAQWAQTSSGSGDATFSNLTVDNSSGNLIAVGYISGTSMFNFGNGASATGLVADQNPLIVAYSNGGNALWARTMTSGNDYAWFSAATTDNYGNIIVVGIMKGATPFGFGNGVTVTGLSTRNNQVIVKYNNSGTAQWAYAMVKSGINFNNICSNNNGTCYAVGFISSIGSQVNFGNGVTLTPTVGTSCPVLLKFLTY